MSQSTWMNPTFSGFAPSQTPMVSLNQPLCSRTLAGTFGSAPFRLNAPRRSRWPAQSSGKALEGVEALDRPAAGRLGQHGDRMARGDAELQDRARRRALETVAQEVVAVLEQAGLDHVRLDIVGAVGARADLQLEQQIAGVVLVVDAADQPLNEGALAGHGHLRPLEAGRREAVLGTAVLFPDRAGAVKGAGGRRGIRTPDLLGVNQTL